MLAEIARQDIQLKPGMLGENIVIDGIAVMALPTGTQLDNAGTLLEVTEVRNPFTQLNEMHPHLNSAFASQAVG